MVNVNSLTAAALGCEREVDILALTDEVEIMLKYEGYLARQEKQVEEFRKEAVKKLGK